MHMLFLFTEIYVTLFCAWLFSTRPIYFWAKQREAYIEDSSIHLRSLVDL